MDIFTTIRTLFSGERVSHADTFILAGVVLFAAFVFNKIRRHFKAGNRLARHAPLYPKVSKNKKPQPRAEVFLNWQPLCKEDTLCRAYNLPSNGTQPLFYIQLAFFSACLASHWPFSAYCSSLRLCHPQHFSGCAPAACICFSHVCPRSRFSDKLLNFCFFVRDRQAGRWSAGVSLLIFYSAETWLFDVPCIEISIPQAHDG